MIHQKNKNHSYNYVVKELISQKKPIIYLFKSSTKNCFIVTPNLNTEISMMTDSCLFVKQILKLCSFKSGTTVQKNFFKILHKRCFDYDSTMFQTNYDIVKK